MKHVRKSVLLWYSPREMYELVTSFERYPEFLPWCAGAQVLTRHDDGVTARLDIAYLGVRHAFTTRNLNVPDESVTVSLVDGPFSTLEGTWLFRPIGAAAAAAGAAAAEPSACRIEFDLRYAFARGPLEAVVSPVFDRIADSFVDAFVQRAEEVYGAR